MPSTASFRGPLCSSVGENSKGGKLIQVARRPGFGGEFDVIADLHSRGGGLAGVQLDRVAGGGLAGGVDVVAERILGVGLHAVDADDLPLGVEVEDVERDQ